MSLQKNWGGAANGNNSLYKKYIEPTVLKRFPQADLILLCGSQGRALSNGNHLPTEGSDYDFVLLFDKLPPKVDAAMFSCQKLEIPGLKEKISIDYKVFDRAALQQHIDHTVKFRRFPFLFTMIMDGHAVIDRKNETADLKKLAKTILKKGPAPLSINQLEDQIDELRAFQKKLQGPQKSSSHYSLALEAVPLLTRNSLLAGNHWASETNRFLNTLEDKEPQAYQKIKKAYEKAISQGSLKALDDIATDLLQDLEAQKKNTDPQYTLWEDPVNDPAHKKIQTASDMNLCRIMVDQYLDRLTVAKTRGEAYELSTQAAIFNTAKWAASLITDNPGLSSDNNTLQFNRASYSKDGRLINKLAQKLAKKDYASCKSLCHTLFQPVGGLRFDYLERIYIDDLMRRDNDSGSAPGNNFSNDNKPKP